MTIVLLFAGKSPNDCEQSFYSLLGKAQTMEDNRSTLCGESPNDGGQSFYSLLGKGQTIGGNRFTLKLEGVSA
jgi:hypothetical protein